MIKWNVCMIQILRIWKGEWLSNLLMYGYKNKVIYHNRYRINLLIPYL